MKLLSIILQQASSGIMAYAGTLLTLLIVVVIAIFIIKRSKSKKTGRL